MSWLNVVLAMLVLVLAIALWRQRRQHQAEVRMLREYIDAVERQYLDGLQAWKRNNHFHAAEIHRLQRELEIATTTPRWGGQ